MDELRIPLFYRVKPDLSEEELNQVLHALRITPVACVIVTDPRHTQQALSFGVEFIYCTEAADDLARSLSQPCVVIGGIQTFQPVFEDMHEESEKA
jgi:hypothetical protein